MRKDSVRILFRCDGGNIPEIGTGHIVRCLLLAKQLRRAGQSVAFAIRRDGSGLARLKKSGFRVFALHPSKDESAALVAAAGAFRAQVIVVDRLDTARPFMSRLKKSGVILITMDDRGPGAGLADICINGMVSSPGALYQGYDYVVLPPREIRKKNISDGCAKIFVSFGGYDHLGLMRKTLKAVERFRGRAKFVLVGDPARTVTPVSAEAKRKLISFGRVEDFDNAVEGCDLAVLSGGLSVYQALSNGVPSIVLSQYKHQMETASRLAADQAVIDLGDGRRVSESDILREIEGLCEDRDKRQTLSRRGQRLVDRRGAERIASLIQIVKILEWDTRFFGKKIARLFPLRVNRDIMRFALRFCAENGVGCLYYLADCHDTESVVQAERNGFHFVDIRITFSIDLDRVQITDGLDEEIEIREYQPGDLRHLKRIAATSYVYSRYYFDRHFSPKICAKFYSDWLEKSCSDPAQKVFIAVVEGKVAGYVSLDRDGFLRGSFPLVGVAREYQNRGVGIRLVKHGLRWFKQEGVHFVEVVTQGRNYGAQRLYQKCGFTTARTQLWYHKWFNPTEKVA